MASGLSGRVYVVTKYRELEGGSFEALEKFDVTDDFERLVDQRLGPPTPVTSLAFEQGVASGDREPSLVQEGVAEVLAEWFPEQFSVYTREVRRGPWMAAS